jgi:polysaccharide deacetylase family protein (PEP-CTERM system associated)
MPSNIFTVDVEEYYHAENILRSVPENELRGLPDRVDIGVNKILDLLAKTNNKATFFVLGCVAEKNPALIKKISDAGHEIASHGYFHIPLTMHTPASFDEDLGRSIKILSDITGRKILGYRATSFSLSGDMPWFFDILRKHGIIYDSSKALSFFRPTSFQGFKGHGYFEISEKVFEFPVSYLKIGYFKMPLGGGYFRAYPYWVTCLGIYQAMHSTRGSFLFYIHPWELDPEQPKAKLPFLKYLRHYMNLAFAEKKLERLLADMKFTSIANFIKKV